MRPDITQIINILIYAQYYDKKNYFLIFLEGVAKGIRDYNYGKYSEDFYKHFLKVVENLKENKKTKESLETYLSNNKLDLYKTEDPCLNKKGIDDNSVESFLNLNSKEPRIKERDIENKIKSIDYIVLKDSFTVICTIRLENGYLVTGQSVCVCSKDFNESIGKGIALTNAKNKIWELEDYLLKEQLYKGSK